MRRAKRLQRDLDAFVLFGREFYEFVIQELDPDPSAPQAYVTSPEAMRAGALIARLRSNEMEPA